MSELIQKNDNCATIRWKLLTGASAFALIASAPAIAGENADHPLLWIEVGGDADIISGIDHRFTAPFLEQTPTPAPFLNGSPVDLQKPSRFTFGGEAKLTFQLEDSDWLFSAGVRYGRSNNKRDVQHQTAVTATFQDPRHNFEPSVYPNPTSTKYAAKFAGTTVNQSEKHLVLDFQAGKDVGLGMFGHEGTSVLSGGVRLARFSSHDDVNIRAKPDVDFYGFPLGKYTLPKSSWSTYYLHGQADRSFNGIGPSLSWDVSTPIAGDVHDGQLSLDWGINGALLFGRQKAKVSHHTTQRDFKAKYYTSFATNVYHGHRTTHYFTQYKHNPPGQNRSRNVTVPNFGANIGLSYRIDDAKLSIGYRADYFFGAMDGGIDARKNTTLGFNGLYASIGIGLGD